MSYQSVEDSNPYEDLDNLIVSFYMGRHVIDLYYLDLNKLIEYRNYKLINYEDHFIINIIENEILKRHKISGFYNYYKIKKPYLKLEDIVKSWRTLSSKEQIDYLLTPP